MGCSTREEGWAANEGSLIRLQDAVAHSGGVAEVEQDTLTLGTSRVGPRWHQQRASEHFIDRNKVRYKTMKGYKSVGGMKNGIALTRWLYSGTNEHDLYKEMAA